MNKQTKGISFKNFRRFQNFPMLQLGNITYMVGRNNSGKSTMVKALLLITDYLQNQLSDTFSFDNVVLEDANIVTFGRAKNNLSKKPNITFEYQLDEFDIHIVISGQDENTKAKVNVLSVNDAKTGIDLNINYSKGNITVSKELIEDEKVDDNKLNVIKQLEDSVSELKEELDAITDKTSKESIELMTGFRKANEKLKAAKNQLPKEIKRKGDKQYVLSYPISLIVDTKKDNNASSSYNVLTNIIEDFIWINDVESSNKKNEKLSKNNQEDVLVLSRNNKHLYEFSKRITQSINRQYFYFIGANPSKQSALFYLRDKNNALAQAIHNFYQLTAGEKNNEETRFIKYWMEIFEVGVDFNINMQAGEAYEFKILEEESKKGESKEEILKKYVSLSDKGMGSLQAMTLILKMASLIRLNEKEKKQITVLVEEPELNLHPDLQSKLTDFFHEVYIKYNFNFIIETHSEYIVRQSQYISLDKNYLVDQELNPNPFSIFYFHKKEGPYEMRFKEDGKFERSFGDGFFNEADKLAMKTYKLNLKNKKNG